MKIRDANPSDFEAVSTIYAHHVLTGTGSFEEEPPSMEELLRRHAAVLANGLPWIVADEEGIVAGYAYAQKFHSRSGWRMTLEDSIYVAPDRIGKGIGRLLLDELMRRCAVLGYGEMIAVIGDSNNSGSIRLHEAGGFVRVGHLKNVGLKFGRRLDVVYMQKSLG